VHANAQLKFYSRSAQESIIKKVTVICEVLGIEIALKDKETIEDHYYDDTLRTLQKNGISLRLRRRNKAALMTIKRSAQPPANNNVLIRDEFELPLSAFRLPELAEIIETISSTLNISVSPKPLIESLAITNERVNYDVRTVCSTAVLSCDRFYYSHAGQYSDTEFLIELESNSPTTSFLVDKQLAALQLLLRDVLDCTPVRRSKLESGVKWAETPVSTHNVHTAIFDLIGYSKLALRDQKQAIQTLNRYAKEALEVIFNNLQTSLAYIPTGDGMLIVFQNHPEKIIPFLVALQNRTKHSSNTNTAFRCGLHSGPVFTYTDINENQNFAGDGINKAQRVMAIGGNYHVLATEAAFESMGRIDLGLQAYFHEIGKRTVKHDISMDIYNVYYKDLEFGNPELPIEQK